MTDSDETKEIKEMKASGFTIKMIELDKLNPAPYNPRKDLKPGDPEYEQIRKSINEFGLVDPLVINSDYTVIGGHQRLKVLREAGFRKAPCSIVNLPKDKEKALNIALNKISGEWDFPKLRDLIIELDTGNFDLDAIGFSEKEAEDLLARQFGLIDLDDLLKEADVATAVKSPIWLVVRADVSEQEALSDAADRLRNDGFKVEVSFGL